jgi:multicomponent Na+:H+ antiporter subunit G
MVDVPVWMSVLGQVFMVLGAAMFATAALGIVRLPDLYTRSSAVATAAGAGIGLLVIGVFLMVPGWSNLVKLAAAVPLQLITSAVGSMAIARAGYLVGSPLFSPRRINALAEEADQRSDET